jgi:hypothetical protein
MTTNEIAAKTNEAKKCDQLMALYVERIAQVARDASQGAATALRAELGRERSSLWLEGAGQLDSALLAIEVGYGDWRVRAAAYLDDVRRLLAHRASLEVRS